LGSLAAGTVADRVGRKPVMMASLYGAGAASLVVAFFDPLEVVVPALMALGLFASAFRPAGNALIADIVPSPDRPRAFALLRVAFNAGFAVGPALAGLLLALGRGPDGMLDPNAFRPLFLADALTSVAFGVFLTLTVPETLPDRAVREDSGAPDGEGGYRRVLRDRRFIAYSTLWIGVHMLYVQLFSTVGPFLADERAFPIDLFAALLSINAAMVVTAQLPTTRLAQRIGPRTTLVVGVILYGGSLSLVAGAGSVGPLIGVIVVLTIGEMLLAPIGDALAADFAPEDARGRYLAVFNLTGAVGLAMGPVAGGLVIDLGWGNQFWIGTLAFAMLLASGFWRVVKPDPGPTVGSPRPAGAGAE
jgi:MFS family permease